MPKCITCGAELHPERAKKYDYCMSRECQEKNAKGLTMVAVGVNKSAEQYFILDEQTKEELASGKYHDQRRGSFGTSVSKVTPSRPGTATGTRTTAATSTSAGAATSGGGAGRGGGAAGRTDKAIRRNRLTSQVPQQKQTSRQVQPSRQGRAPRPTPRAAARKPWSDRQERLALLYNEQGLPPGQIAEKLGLSSYVVTQIVLSSRNRGKL
jgi:hypothetical protein